MCVYIECVLQFLYPTEMAGLKKQRIFFQFCFIFEKPHSETYELFKNAFFITPWAEYEPLSGSYVSEVTQLHLILNIQVTHSQVRLREM